MYSYFISFILSFFLSFILSFLMIAAGVQVNTIQEEYQKYMEQVRNKAQTAIDEVNVRFTTSRTHLSSELDSLVRTLDQNFFNVLSGPRGLRPDDAPAV